MALKGPRTGSYTNSVNTKYNFNRLPVADFVTAQTPAGPDEYFKNTTLLLSTSVTNGAQNNTFLDSSDNNFTITRNGNATQGSLSPHSLTGWSNYFDGTGDSLSLSNNTNLDLGSTTGDFTVEAWVYLNAMPTGTSTSSWSEDWSSWFIIYERSGGGTNGWQFRIGQTLLTLGGDGDTSILWGTHGMVTRTWYHVAVTRSGSTYRLFVNGSQIASGTSATGLGSGGTYYIGSEDTSGAYFNGYISNLRVLKGTALYTSAFTPPTSPLTAISNTSLLTCQSNRFIDNSTNNFTITRNGDTSVQSFGPFAPTDSYSTSVVGGSGYFDGTGDFLTVPSNAAFGFGTGNFTVEFWIYPTANFSNYAKVFVIGSSFAIETQTTLNTLAVTDYSSTVFFTSSTALSLNTWTHIAVTRSGTSLKLFQNGTEVGSATNSTNFVSDIAYIGGRVSSTSMTGYISNLRVVKGTAVYTGNFTPPTAPVLVSGSSTPYTNTSNVNTTFAAANTSLLCDFTNAGIIDATGRNVMETVGNAQASTTQTKFGSSSMYFDGTGDWLTIPNSSLFTLGSSNFTFELWAYVTQQNSNQYYLFFGKRPSTGAQNYLGLGVRNNVAVLAFANGTSGGWGSLTSGNINVSLNTWTHFALSRSGSNINVYVNGVKDTSASIISSAAVVDNTSPFYVGTGTADAGGEVYVGYIDDLRITRFARYTDNFTPPTRTFSLR